MTLSRTFLHQEINESMYLVHTMRKALAYEIKAIRKATWMLIRDGHSDCAKQWQIDTRHEIKGKYDFMRYVEDMSGYAILSKTRAAARKAGRHVN